MIRIRYATKENFRVPAPTQIQLLRVHTNSRRFFCFCIAVPPNLEGTVNQHKGIAYDNFYVFKVRSNLLRFTAFSTELYLSILKQKVVIHPILHLSVDFIWYVT